MGAHEHSQTAYFEVGACITNEILEKIDLAFVRQLPWRLGSALLKQLGRLEPFKVQDIRVEGLQRVEAGTVFASMPLRVGDDYSDDKGAAAIRSLFALGLFKDVRLEANGNVLVVVVEERPTIAGVEFVGTERIRQGSAAKSHA